MENEKIKIVYKEVFEQRRQQQVDLDIIMNKFNWILVSDVIVLISVVGLKQKNIFVFISILLILVSIYFVFKAMLFKPYKTGPSFEKLNNAALSGDYSECAFLKGLNTKIAKAINKNKGIIEKFSANFEIAFILLIVGSVFIFLNIFFSFHFIFVVS